MKKPRLTAYKIKFNRHSNWSDAFALLNSKDEIICFVIKEDEEWDQWDKEQVFDCERVTK